MRRRYRETWPIVSTDLFPLCTRSSLPARPADCPKVTFSQRSLRLRLKYVTKTKDGFNLRLYFLSSLSVLSNSELRSDTSSIYVRENEENRSRRDGCATHVGQICNLSHDSEIWKRNGTHRCRSTRHGRWKGVRCTESLIHYSPLDDWVQPTMAFSSLVLPH